MTGAAEIPLLPEYAAGHSRPLTAGAHDWVAVAWLLAAEVRALLEDYDGGTYQPELRHVVALRLVEVLAEVDARLVGLEAPSSAHALALALEYGFRGIARTGGSDLFVLAGLDRGLDALDDAGAEMYVLGARIVDEFPGPLPDRLVAESEGHIRECLALWERLLDRAGANISTLRRLQREA